ncbi:MAG: hypothetical protein M3N08_03175 [Pseudomonadota bacterium]|nr:hypothetical protein [Pseudomonadota bacterium]
MKDHDPRLTPQVDRALGPPERVLKVLERHTRGIRWRIEAYMKHIFLTLRAEARGADFLERSSNGSPHKTAELVDLDVLIFFATDEMSRQLGRARSLTGLDDQDSSVC